MLYVSKVELKNFRCFEDVTVEADVGGAVAPWTLLTGDNASGKTTLLRAIALGLCDMSSAAGLLRESDSGYIRHDKDWGRVRISLVESEGHRAGQEFRITTTLTQLHSRLESLEQETEPSKDFPWGQIFVCGYGAGRGTSGTGDIADYTAISAVYNLFNYTEGLQNPELAIRRLPYRSDRRQGVLEVLRRILNLTDISLAENGSRDKGIIVRDPRDVDVALRDLADGYKSTFLWVTDFLGWALTSGRSLATDVDGIVIIDELEQHLHPKWQKQLIKTLREVWPRVQFFTSTHSPLVARSFHPPAEDDGPYRHYHLRNSETSNSIEGVLVPSLWGSRTDQILASQAFDFELDDDPDVERILMSLSLLAGNEFLTAEQRKQAEDYLVMVKRIESMRTGQTAPERSASFWADITRRAAIDALDQEVGGTEE